MENKCALRLFQCLIVQILLSAPALSVIPVVTPLSKVAVLDPDTSHDFVCTANGSNPAFDSLIVRVDGLQSVDEDIQARGIHVSLNSEGNSYNITITVPATTENNDTKIQCFFFTENGSKSSMIATFLVQGLLEAPVTEIVSVNDSHLLFSWTPPFSLDLPDSDPDISFYSFSENLTSSHSKNVTDVQPFIFPVLATAVEFSVTAWNIVGEGERATDIDHPCTLSEAQQEASVTNVKQEVIYEENERFILSLYISWSVDCFPLFSLELSEDGSEEEKELHDRLVPRVAVREGEKIIELSIPLPGKDNTHYTAQLTSISSQRSLTSQILFSTHDVQSVEITHTTTSITISCLFATGSQARGCSIHISLRDDDANSTPMNLSAIRESNNQELPLVVQTTAQELKSDEYIVRVYDIESDGATKTDEEPAHTLFVDISQPTTQPPLTTSSSSSSSSSSPSSNTTPDVITDRLNREDNQSENVVPIIAGGIVGVVLLISLILLILVSVVVLKRRKKKEEKDSESRGGEFVLIATTGGTISSESVDAAGYLNPAHTLQVSSSSIQSHTLPLVTSTSLKKTTLSKKESLPPAYSDLEPTVCLHVRSMSDVVTTSSSRRIDDLGGVVSEENSHSESMDNSSSPTSATTRTNQTLSQKRAVEATLSAPPTSPPPPPIPQISPRLVPKITSHTHLMRHERSSSLGGPHPLSTSSSAIPPPHLPKKTRQRVPPVSSSSTSALLPPRLTSPPVSFSLSSSLTTQETTPEVSSLEANDAVGKNPLYDTAAALKLKKEQQKRKSIQYMEVVAKSGTEATPSKSTLPLPPDNSLVLYSEVNINELVPKLPNKKNQVQVPFPPTIQHGPTDEQYY